MFVLIGSLPQIPITFIYVVEIFILYYLRIWLEGLIICKSKIVDDLTSYFYFSTALFLPNTDHLPREKISDNKAQPDVYKRQV